MLEELEHARARGAPILAEFLGGSFTCDAHHMTEPQPQGAGVKLCIERWALGLTLMYGAMTCQAQICSYKTPPLTSNVPHCLISERSIRSELHSCPAERARSLRACRREMACIHGLILQILQMCVGSLATEEALTCGNTALASQLWHAEMVSAVQ